MPPEIGTESSVSNGMNSPVTLKELVEYISSSRVIDYTSMSDFFLTFRLYATASDVLDLLLERFEHAMTLSAEDPRSEEGRDCAVRTFVVLRHWIDNFFADDFLPDLSLREHFVDGVVELERHEYAAASPQFALIFTQLAKVWNRRLKAYWDVATLDTWPIVAGGEFGAQEIDATGRRRTLLSFYSGPIDPMQSPDPNHRGDQLGSIIRGGLLVSSNPEVPFIRTTPKKQKHSRSLFFRRHKADEQSELQLEGKVDLLALRVLTELEALVRVRNSLRAAPRKSAIAQTAGASTMKHSSSQNTIRAHDTVDTLNIAQVLDDTTSFDDDGSFVDLRRSTVANNLLDDIPFDRASYNSFSSLSTVSLRAAAGDSASMRSEGVRRERTRESTYAADQVDNISLLSELTSGYEMAPCAGFNQQIAAELAAIPDESVGEDAILVALQKLEGTWQDTHAPVDENPNLRVLCNAIRSVPSFVSADTNLYAQAFGPATDMARRVSDLAIPRSSTPPPFFLGDEVQRLSSSTMSTRQRQQGADLNQHVPFILSLSAQTLAEQMTLLEKDAIEQIDWKDLVEIKWTQSKTEINSWLRFLATHQIRGVDVVTARFNLVLNWVRSEIVLCCQASIQARTIQRFIHIAVECEKLQNFATMFQLVLALTSNSLRNRVATGWSLLDKQDLEALARLERLVNPRQNFHHLRAAHKNIRFSEGCIPFTGLYLADLLYNNEKPSIVEGKINFPKFKTASSISRSLIQCIEWSRNYRIMPKPDLLSKCLYLHSLSTEEWA